MTFSPQLEARFAKLLASYPPGRERSAMIPMLLYAQDELGSVSDELIAEVATRTGVTPLEVTGVISYYSMLRRKPAGKYHVQVCTNVSCQLLGSDKLTEHICARLKVKPGETTPDKKFTVTEVECLGSCGTAPMMQVNDEYYEGLTTEAVDKLLAELK